MPRVLIGMPASDARGGITACEPSFVAALRALGVEVSETTYVYGAYLTPVRLATRVWRVAASALRLRREVRRGLYDVVHLNTSFDTKTVLRDSVTLALAGDSTPVFLKLHGSHPALLSEGRRPVRTLARFVLRRATSIGVLSATERRQFVEAGVPAAKLAIVRNALPDVRPTFSEPGAFRLHYGLPTGVPLLLFVSRVVAAKGLLDAVRACAILRDRGVPVVLCCVGDGPARPEAEEAATHLGLAESVRFLGHLPEAEVADFYAGCDVLVFPSFDNEGLPLVLLNALAAGLPIVTTHSRGADDYLSEPETCLWIEPHRPDHLAERVEHLLGDHDLRAAMGARARSVAGAFAPDVVAREYLGLYERLASPRKSSSDVHAPLVMSVGSDVDSSS